MKKTLLKSVALAAAISLATASAGFATGGSIGFGDISVYKDGQLVSKLTGQNPIEDGALLICNSKCMIKSEGISLVGEGSAQVAVTSEDDTFKIYVKEGKVDYIINSNVRKISFHTPDGTYTVAEVVFNASNQAVVKGSVVVDSKGNTEISVTEGRMVFATADGMKTVDANNKIVLAQLAEGGAGVGLGVAAVATLAAVPIIGTLDNGDGGSSAAPQALGAAAPVAQARAAVPVVTPPPLVTSPNTP